MEIEDYVIVITEVDVKLNKWNTAMEKLYRKPTKTTKLYTNYDPTAGLNHAPETLPFCLIVDTIN